MRMDRWVGMRFFFFFVDVLEYLEASGYGQMVQGGRIGHACSEG